MLHDLNTTDGNGKLNILIICYGPFGFTTAAYELSNYLTHKYNVTYLCLRDREALYMTDGMVSDSLVVKAIHREDRLLLRVCKWLASCISVCRGKYDLVYLYYFPLCSVVRLANPAKRFILDIRSGAVSPSHLKRNLLNVLTLIDSTAFKHISVLCESMRRHLHLPAGRTHILPLGANPIDVPKKEFSRLHLLYVGTFFNRRLDDTIKGFSRYFREKSKEMDMRYTLIGDSPTGDRQRLCSLVQELGLVNVICLQGYVRHDRLKSFYEHSNIGVSYVPIVPYYDCQPPTKTYEYLFAGMPVIATATRENAKIVTGDNGILIEDSPEGFYQGLCKMAARLPTFDSQRIRASVSDFSWHNIMTNNALPFIEDVAGYTS